MSFAHEGRSRPRIAFWTPLAPVRSGISDYSESLLEYLSELIDIDVFIDGYQPESQPLWNRVPAIDARQFRPRHAARPYDASLFHLGNNSCHAYMADALLGAPCPSIGVFHDGSMYHLFEGVSTWRLMGEIQAEEGWHSMLRAWRRRRLPGSDTYAHPLLTRLARACQTLVTHSQFLAQRCRTFAPDQLIRVVPFGAEYYEDDNGRFQAQARCALGLPADAVIFGVFGHLNGAKRIAQVVDAFCSANLDNTYLYLVGQMDPFTPPHVREMLWDRDATHRCRIRLDEGRRPYKRVLLSMHAVDVGINLRSPTTGETSSILCSLLGMGKPAIVSDVGAFSELPDDCVYKVPPTSDESALLVRAICEMAQDPARRQNMAAAARIYSRSRTWRHAAQAYRDLIDDALACGLH